MNLKLGRVFGIKIQVHFTFLLIVFWGAFRYGGRGLDSMAYGIFSILLLFGIVLLHELGHSVVALALGIRVRDITLLPIGGLARLERMPDKPLHEFMVAVAGPMVNVLLVFVFLPVLWILFEGRISMGRLLYVLTGGPSVLNLMTVLAATNIMLLLFNLIPAFPLDGGRIFRSLLAMVIGEDTATRVAVWVGRFFAVILGLYGLVSGNILLALISVFIFFVGGAEGRAMAVKSALRGISVRYAVSRVGTILPPSATIMEVASATLYSHQSNFPVMLGDALIGVIRRRDIRQALERGRSLVTVADVMKENIPNLHIDMPLSDAQEQLLSSGSSVAAVFEGRQFMGLISFEDIERAFQLFRHGVPQPV